MGMPLKMTVVALLSVGVSALGAAVLSGCQQRPVEIVAPPAQRSSPMFASDEDALAAATVAYAKYLAVLDQVLSDGGANAERLETVEVGEALASDKKDVLEYMTGGYRSTGVTTFDSAEIQSLRQGSGFGSVDVSIYVCSDVSGIDVLDSDGVSMVSPNRIFRTPFQLDFVAAAEPARLLLSTSTLWTGMNFC